MKIDSMIFKAIEPCNKTLSYEYEGAFYTASYRDIGETDYTATREFIHGGERYYLYSFLYFDYLKGTSLDYVIIQPNTIVDTAYLYKNSVISFPQSINKSYDISDFKSVILFIDIQDLSEIEFSSDEVSTKAYYCGNKVFFHKKQAAKPNEVKEISVIIDKNRFCKWLNEKKQKIG